MQLKNFACVCVHLRACVCVCVRPRPSASFRVHPHASACVCLRVCVCAQKIKCPDASRRKKFLRPDASFVQGISGCTITGCHDLL